MKYLRYYLWIIGNTGKSQANFHLGRQHGVAATIGSNL